MKFKEVDVITLFSFSFGLSTFFIHPPFLPYVVIICALLDLVDGYVARITKTQNVFGMILDEMSDIVLFSILPAIALMIAYPYPILIPLVIAFASAGLLRHARIVDEKYKETKGATSTSVAVFTMLLIIGHVPVTIVAFLLPLLSYTLLSERKYLNHKEVEKRMGLGGILALTLIGLVILLSSQTLALYVALMFLAGYIFFGWLAPVHKP